MCPNQRALAKLTPILTLSTPLEAPASPPQAKLISTYQIRGTKLHFTLARLLGFKLGNRGGLEPKINST